MKLDGPLLLVGCGKMGGALLEGWLARGLAASDAIVAEPVEALQPRKDGLRCVARGRIVPGAPAGGFYHEPVLFADVPARHPIAWFFQAWARPLKRWTRRFAPAS